MHHIYLTERKITRYLELLNLMVYQVRQPLPPFRFQAGNDAFVASDVDDSHWPVITPDSSWGGGSTGVYAENPLHRAQRLEGTCRSVITHRK